MHGVISNANDIRGASETNILKFAEIFQYQTTTLSAAFWSKVF